MYKWRLNKKMKGESTAAHLAISSKADIGIWSGTLPPGTYPHIGNTIGHAGVDLFPWLKVCENLFRTRDARPATEAQLQFALHFWPPFSSAKTCCDRLSEGNK